MNFVSIVDKLWAWGLSIKDVNHIVIFFDSPPLKCCLQSLKTLSLGSNWNTTCRIDRGDTSINSIHVKKKLVIKWDKFQSIEKWNYCENFFSVRKGNDWGEFWTDLFLHNLGQVRRRRELLFCEKKQDLFETGFKTSALKKYLNTLDTLHGIMRRIL